MIRRCLFPLAVCWLLGLCLAVQASSGQNQEPVTSTAVTLATHFNGGVRAARSAQYPEAVAQLETVFDAMPGYYMPGTGAAAYWLGQAYLSSDRPDEGAAVWQAGLEALASVGILDVDLADAFIWHVFSHEDETRYTAAAKAYLGLLASLDRDLPAQQQAVVAKHLRPLALIVPKEVRTETGLDAFVETGRLPDRVQRAGARLVRWWRSEDALPATPQHERLEEHLARVAYAMTHYRTKDAAGFDDRGGIYIRLGPPHREATFTFQGMNLHILQRSPNEASHSAFPNLPALSENAFWVYNHVHSDAQYLFIRQPGQGYRLGEPFDLIPPRLRSGLSTVTERGRQKGRVLLEVLKSIYGQLAQYHQHYIRRYDDIATYIEKLENVELTTDLRRAAEVLPQGPAAFAQSMLMDGQSEDRQASRRRQDQVPHSYANVFGEAEPLPVTMRWARFLDPDGTTRTELYWSLAAETLHPSKRFSRRLEQAGHIPASHYLLKVTSVQQTMAYQERVVQINRHLVPAADGDAGEVLPTQVMITRGDQRAYRLALQWDTYWADVETGAVHQPGPRLKIGSYQLDSLQALDDDPGLLEMSDLKPLLVAGETPLLEEAEPYPHRAIMPMTPLALYFEVYHLVFDADDQTHYTVEYEVARSREKGDLLPFLGGGTDHQTTVQTRYTGDSRTAHEYIVLDLSAWTGEGQLNVTVRVTDETTGQQIERSLAFEMQL